MATKKCNKCLTVQCLTQFHKSAKTKDGKKSQCKQCCKKYQNDFRSGAHVVESLEAKREREQKAGEKPCITCKEVKPLYDYRNRRDNGVTKLMSKCKRCCSEYQLNYRKKSVVEGIEGNEISSYESRELLKAEQKHHSTTYRDLLRSMAPTTQAVT